MHSLHKSRANSHNVFADVILMAFCNLANLSPSAHVADLRHPDDIIEVCCGTHWFRCREKPESV